MEYRQIISTPIPMEFNHPNWSPYASVKPSRRMGIRKLTKVKHTHQMNAFLIRNVSFFFSLFATTGGHLSIKYSTNCGVCFQKRAPSLRTEKETHTGTQGLQLTCCLWRDTLHSSAARNFINTGYYKPAPKGFSAFSCSSELVVAFALA